MIATSRPDDLTPSVLGYRVALATVEVAMEVAAERLADPSAFPTLPSEDLPEHLTRKMLAQLINVGLIDPQHAPDLFVQDAR